VNFDHFSGSADQCPEPFPDGFHSSPGKRQTEYAGWMAVLHLKDSADPHAEDFRLSTARTSNHPNRTFRFQHSCLLLGIQPAESPLIFLNFRFIHSSRFLQRWCMAS
jgi:hypothetical protein